MERGLLEKSHFKFGKTNVIFFVFIFIIFGLFFASASPILDQLHLNIQTTDSNGNVITGTYNFVFNISTTPSCSNVVYSKSATLTTDSRGIISYYLNNTGLNYENQYYLCYYRNGVLVDTSSISRTPYSFTARNVSLSGVSIDTNLDMGLHNVSATYFFGSGKYLTNLNASAINSSAINYWTKSGSNLYYTGGNVGIGTTNPGGYKLYMQGPTSFSSGLGYAVSNWNTAAIVQVNDVNPYETDSSPNRGMRLLQYGNGGAYGGGISWGMAPQSNGNWLSGAYSTGQFLLAYNGNNLQLLGSNQNPGNSPTSFSPTNFLTILNAGNVGIGTTGPNSLLALNVPNNGTSQLLGQWAGVNDGNTGTFSIGAGESGNLRAGISFNKFVDGSYSSTNIQFTTLHGGVSNGVRMTIDKDGNVGIGTTSPNQRLQVAGSVNAYNYLVNGTPISAGSLGALTGSGTANYVPLWNGTKSQTNSVIYQSGNNIGIGTTSTNLGGTGSNVLTISGANPYLELNSVTGSHGQLRFYNNGTYIGGMLKDASQNMEVVSTTGHLLSLYADGGTTPTLTVNGGNVGIGTTSPSTKLQIQDLSNNPTLLINGSVGFSTPILRLYANNPVIQYGNAGLLFQSVTDSSGGGNTNRVIFDSNGNVGIGTTNPVTTLDIQGNVPSNNAVVARIKNLNATGYGSLRVQADQANGLEMDSFGSGMSGSSTYNTGPNGVAIVNVNNAALALGTNNAGVIYINNSKVGIGTASPGNSLEIAKGASYTEIVGSPNNPSIRIRNTNSANFNEKAEVQFVVGNSLYPTAAITDLYTSWVSPGASSGNIGSDLVFSTRASTDTVNTLTERMRITGSGNVGIGTTNPSNTLDVGGGDLVVNSTSGNVGIGTTHPTAKLQVSGGDVIIGI
jgi:hypothetical protein